MPYVLITPPALNGVTSIIIRKYPGSYAKYLVPHKPN